MDAAFDAADLERRYAFLDDCPEALLGDVVTLAVGSLSERVAGVKAWREALLAGCLPPAGTWPGEDLAGPVRKALQELDLARFTKGQPDLVDALLKDVLEGVSRQAGRLQSEVLARLRELEELERVGAEADRPREAGSGGRKADRHVPLDEATLERLREAALEEVLGRERPADAAMTAKWGERARAWAQVSDVFGDLGQMMGRGWDLARGVLRQVGWTDLLRLRALVERLPQLRDLIRTLGRMRASDEGEPVTETLMVPVRRLEEERREVRTPGIPAETRGIERSGEIPRMLPAEAALLGHPILRLLWHARRAERALVTYRVEGTEVRRVRVERETREERTVTRPRPRRGPILVVVDTSGSMHGLPEQVAKAVVLEAMRTAHAERRRCLVYAYSGPGQVLEQELDLSEGGVGRLMDFLGLSFGGGNDEAGVMAKVVERLRQEDWRKADVLFVSDGEWPAPPALVESVRAAREQGTRFHGVQIGNRGFTGLHAVCDPVHVFTDWAALGGR